MSTSTIGSNRTTRHYATAGRWLIFIRDQTLMPVAFKCIHSKHYSDLCASNWTHGTVESKALDNDLAFGCSGFDERMGLAQVFGIDRA